MKSTPGARLRHLRELLGFEGKQQEFADRIGLSQQSVSNMERNKTEPATKSLNKIYAAFQQVNISWLVTGVGDPLDTMRDGRPLTSAADLTLPIPSETSEINSDRELVRMMTEGDIRISDTSGPPYRMRRITRTAEEEMEHLRLELLRERQAHERTRERYEAASNQNHERETKLIALIGGGSFNDASPDAADTYATEMRISHVTPDWQRFVAPKPAVYEYRRIGF